MLVFFLFIIFSLNNSFSMNSDGFKKPRAIVKKTKKVGSSTSWEKRKEATEMARKDTRFGNFSDARSCDIKTLFANIEAAQKGQNLDLFKDIENAPESQSLVDLFKKMDVSETDKNQSLVDLFKKMDVSETDKK